MKRNLLLLLLALYSCLFYAQPKLDGEAPIREKRGYDQRFVIDTAKVRVLYALNAKDKIYVWEAVAIERGTFKISQYPDKLYPKSTRETIWKRQVKFSKDYWNCTGVIWLDPTRAPKGHKEFKALELE